MKHKADIAIAGGGPAGLAVAIFARLKGHAVVVLEQRRQMPIDKCCGEGIMPPGVAMMQKMGLDIDPDGVSEYKGIRYIEAADPKNLITAEARLPGAPGWGVRRTHLHGEMLRRAEELGVEIRLGTKVTGFTERGFTTHDGLVEATWLVAADGLHSTLRSKSGLVKAHNTSKRVGVRRHYQIPPWNDCVEVYLGKSCEAYVTPVGPNRVGIALLNGGSGAVYDTLIEQFPDLRHRLQDAPVDSEIRGAGPLHQETSAVIKDNLALIGDASAFGDALTGEGLSLAFRSAFVLVEAIGKGDLTDYADIHAKFVRRYRTGVRIALGVTQRLWLRRWVVRLFQKFPRLFERTLSKFIDLEGDSVEVD